MRIIAGEARGRRLEVPPETAVRPALDRIRESIFAIVGESLAGGNVLDLFAGSGAFGLESISRGARRALFVELDPEALVVLKRNVLTLGFTTRCELLQADALRQPPLRAREDDRYALIFLDPPFSMLSSSRLTETLWRRVDDAIEATAREGWTVVRLPTRWKGTRPQPPTLEKKYGESRVLFYRAPTDAERSAAADGVTDQDKV